MSKFTVTFQFKEVYYSKAIPRGVHISDVKRNGFYVDKDLTIVDYVDYNLEDVNYWWIPPNMIQTIRWYLPKHSE